MIYNSWVFIHVIGVLGFFVAHGVSTGVALQIRRERSPDRLRTLLELSASTSVAFYIASALLLLGGIGAGIDGHWFSHQAWVSVALAVFLAEMGFMYAMTKPYYGRLRRVMTIEQSGGTAVGPQEIEQLVMSRVPLVSLSVGSAGLVFIVYLMVFQPTW